MCSAHVLCISSWLCIALRKHACQPTALNNVGCVLQVDYALRVWASVRAALFCAQPIAATCLGGRQQQGAPDHMCAVGNER